MKTRTLLLLSVGTALAILLAGGILLYQLTDEQQRVETGPVGTPVEVGDVTVTVLGATGDGERFVVDVELGGLDDPDGTDSFRLVTGDRRLSPLDAPADGRCTEITEASRRCALEFDVSGVDSSSRVLILRRGDQQRTWSGLDA